MQPLFIQGLISSLAALYTSFLFLCILGVHINVIWNVKALVKLPPGREKIPAFIVFGDSIADTGNNNDLETLAKCNFLPYGRDFEGGVPTGRFSNGKVSSDFIAEVLGIKELLPAYRDPTLKPEDLLTGVSFASGGSGFDPLTSEIASVTSLPEQLIQFKEYKEKLKQMIGEEGTKDLLSKSLFMVISSSNDIANTYFDSGIRASQYQFSSYSDILVGLASNIVQELYTLGARKIGVLGAPPVGCLPSTRVIAGGTQRQCNEDYNNAAKLFNTKLSAELVFLNIHWPSAKLVYIDIYYLLLQLIQNPRDHGFKVVDKGCCGTGNLEAAMFCNELNPFTCTNASEYFFWDSYHPTERAYEVLVSILIKENYNKFF